MVVTANETQRGDGLSLVHKNVHVYRKPGAYGAAVARVHHTVGRVGWVKHPPMAAEAGAGAEVDERVGEE